MLENPTPFHNHDDPYDVDHGGDVSALDALAIINYLNSFGPGPVGQGSSGLCYDVNADGFVTALDALLVLNEMNRRENRDSVDEEEAGGEGEQIAEGENLNDGFAQSAPQTRIGQNESLSPIAKLVDASHLSDSAADAINIPNSASTSSEEFAQNVDETLRLLSEKSS